MNKKKKIGMTKQMEWKRRENRHQICAFIYIKYENTYENLYFPISWWPM